MKKWLKKWKIPFLLSAFPGLFLVFFFLFRYNFFPLYEPLIQEDAFFETLQFLFYFTSSIVLAFQVVRLRNFPKFMRFLLLLGALTLFFVAGEEISWGQRIFDIQNPEYFTERNIQKELSIHNLDSFQPLLHGSYIILCLVLSLAELLFFLLSKATKKIKFLKKNLPYFSRFIPKWYLASYFLPVSVFYILFDYWRPFGAVMRNGVLLMVGRDQEVFETLLALGIMVTLFLSVKKEKRSI